MRPASEDYMLVIGILMVVAVVLALIGSAEAHTRTPRQAQAVVVKPWRAFAIREFRRANRAWGGRVYWATRPYVRCWREPDLGARRRFNCWGYAVMKRREPLFKDPAVRCTGHTKWANHVHWPRPGWSVYWRYRKCGRFT